MSGLLGGIVTFTRRLVPEERNSLVLRAIRGAVEQGLAVQFGHSICQRSFVVENLLNLHIPGNLWLDQCPFLVLDSPVSDVSHELLTLESFGRTVEAGRQDMFDRLKRVERFLQIVKDEASVASIRIIACEGSDPEPKRIQIPLTDFATIVSCESSPMRIPSLLITIE